MNININQVGKDGCVDRTSAMGVIVLKEESLSDKELRSVAELHRESIDKGFLSQLGNRFLYILYKAINETDGSRLIVAKHGHEVVGFVAGTEGLGGVYRTMIKKHTLSVFLSLFPNILYYKNIGKLIELIFHIGGKSSEGAFPASELLSLAVKGDYRREGVARKLVQALIESFRKDCVDEFKIVVGKELREAQRFYERIGAVRNGSLEVHKGAESYIYIMEIPS